MLFYLGTHKPAWLHKVKDVPLFVSHRRLREVRYLEKATTSWALDSGGFSELSMYGGWKTTATEYARQAIRYCQEIGSMAFAAIQDWMCEPMMLERTGRSVAYHQAKTIASYLDLKALAPSVPWMPVVQGWDMADYCRCVEEYIRQGINLEAREIVGLGSVCRRQDTEEIGAIASHLSKEYGLKLHGFGVKQLGIARYGACLASSDSMAWSFHARKRPAMPGHTHKNCANCLDYALAWRGRLLGGRGNA